MKVGSDPWPFDKKVAFAIRDDDVSYFTQPWMLDMLYSDAWRLGFRVSLAVIPYVKATRLRLVPHSLRGSNRLFSISENKELVDYLLEKIAGGYVDIVQHGYTHAHEDGKPEFAINNFKLIDERLTAGNRLLRETFKQDITVFTAPHEGVSRATWKSLSRNKMCLCRRFTLGRFLVTASIFSVDFPKLVKLIVHCPNPFKPISSSIIDITDTLAVQWDTFLWSQSRIDIKVQLERAKETFLKRLNKGEAFVMSHHHWDYFYNWASKMMKQEMLTCFKDFLNFVSSYDGVWKTTLREICMWAKNQV